ncbi:MAG: hypothetical protein MJ078_06265, partial [Clostridia bacterium]|nr:hypothetical protein [Clostridia bacterium]
MNNLKYPDRKNDNLVTDKWYDGHRSEVTTMTVNYAETTNNTKKTAEYTLSYNGTYYTSFSTHESGTANDNFAYKEPGTGNFTVLGNMSGTVYSVRTYSKTLTADEARQNHFADLAAFYGLDVKNFVEYPATEKKAIYAKFADYVISETNYNATKKTLQKMLLKTVYDDLYVTDHLVGLFTAFGKDFSVSLSSGKWLNKIGKGDVTLNGGTYDDANNPTGWFVGTHGGVRYDDEGYSASGSSLSLDNTLFGGKNDPFTVDSFAKMVFRDIKPTYKTYSDSDENFVREGSTTVKLDTKEEPQLVSASGMIIHAHAEGSANTTKTVHLFATNNKDYSTPADRTTDKDVTLTFDAGGNATVSLQYVGRYAKYTLLDGVTLTSVEIRVNDAQTESCVQDAFQFGPAYCMIWTNLQGSNNWGNGYGLTRFYYSANNWSGSNSGSTVVSFNDNNGFVNNFSKKGIKGFEVTKSLAANNDVTYTYGANGTAFCTYSVTSDKTIEKDAFVMFRNLPASVYAVRVYSK